MCFRETVGEAFGVRSMMALGSSCFACSSPLAWNSLRLHRMAMHDNTCVCITQKYTTSFGTRSTGVLKPGNSRIKTSVRGKDEKDPKSE
jgi:hypothetical protein